MPPPMIRTWNGLDIRSSFETTRVAGARCLGSEGAVLAELSLLFCGCVPEASALRAFGFRVQDPAMFQHCRVAPMPMIGSHGALPCDAVCFVPTRAVSLQFAPQVEGTPAF